MRDTIKKWMWQLFPELSSGYHLPQLAEVTAIADPPIEGEKSTAFRPFYAVDIQPLDHQLQPKGPVFKGVPLPLPAAGHNRGLFGFPELGALVSYQRAYGSPARPIITNVYPHHGQTMPNLTDTELLWQQQQGISQRCDTVGNWSTETHKGLSENIGEVAERIAKLKQRLIVKDGGKVWLGNESVNVIRVLDDLCKVVQQVASTAATHTHSYTDDGNPMTTEKPNQAGNFTEQSTKSRGLSSEINPIIDA